MARHLIFDPSNPAHCHHYEMAHVLILQNRTPLSPLDSSRLADLQDAWEQNGVEDPSVLVMDSPGFKAYRYALKPGGEAVSIYLEEAVFDVLKRVAETASVVGFLARYQRDLLRYLAAVDVVELGTLIKLDG